MGDHTGYNYFNKKGQNLNSYSSAMPLKSLILLIYLNAKTVLCYLGHNKLVTGQ